MAFPTTARRCQPRLRCRLSKRRCGRLEHEIQDNVANLLVLDAVGIRQLRLVATPGESRTSRAERGRSRCRSRPLAAPTSSSTSLLRMSNGMRSGVNWMRQVSSPSPASNRRGRDIDLGLETGALDHHAGARCRKDRARPSFFVFFGSGGGAGKRSAGHRNPVDRMQGTDDAPFSASSNNLGLPPRPLCNH